MNLVCATHPSALAVARCVNCGLHLCSDCRTLEGIRNFCARCRADLRHASTQDPQAFAAAIEVPPHHGAVAVPQQGAAAASSTRSPSLAAFLSLVPGLGQAYSGRVFRGAIFFGAAMALRSADWVTPVLAAFLYAFNLFDAYRLAQIRSEGHSRGRAPLRADDTLFLLVGIGTLAATLLASGGFLAAPGVALLPLAGLATSLVLAHETRR